MCGCEHCKATVIVLEHFDGGVTCSTTIASAPNNVEVKVCLYQISISQSWVSWHTGVIPKMVSGTFKVAIVSSCITI